MKKILAIVLVLCSLISMSTIFASADTDATESELPKWELGSYFNGGEDNSLTAHDTAPFNLVQYYVGGNDTWTARGLPLGEHDLVKGEDIDTHPNNGQNEEAPSFNNGP